MHGFGPNGNSIPLPSPLKIAGVEIERIGSRFPTKSFKLVGVHLDDNLNWNEQAAHARGKLSKTNYGLARAKRCLPSHIKKMVYNSLFKCHLEYCLPIWGDCSSSFCRGFLSMQKTAVRNIASAKFNSHTDPLFRKFKILKFKDLYSCSVGTFMFNLTMGLHPPQICDMVSKSDNFDRNLNYKLDKLPYVYLQKLVPHSLAKVWNSLNIAHRNWLKEKPIVRKKLINAPPSLVPQGFNFSLNNFRLKGFKKSTLDSLVYRYSEKVNCNNSYCRDCA